MEGEGSVVQADDRAIGGAVQDVLKVVGRRDLGHALVHGAIAVVVQQVAALVRSRMDEVFEVIAVVVGRGRALVGGASGLAVAVVVRVLAAVAVAVDVFVVGVLHLAVVGGASAVVVDAIHFAVLGAGVDAVFAVVAVSAAEHRPRRWTALGGG